MPASQTRPLLHPSARKAGLFPAYTPPGHPFMRLARLRLLRLPLLTLGLAATAGAALGQTYSTPYSIVTLAGHAGAYGSADNVGANAYFYLPKAVAIDASGNLYVADTANSTIRVVGTLAGSSYELVNTLAGKPGTAGAANGPSTSALFNQPSGVAVDGSGNVYVADTGNNLVRKITIAGGTVSTLAGSGQVGHVDGTGTGAAFSNPVGIAVDGSGNVYVADEGTSVIRKITPAGVVSTIAGQSQVFSHVDGPGASATFNHPEGLAIDASGNLYVADTGNQVIRKITSAGVVSTIAGTAGVTGSADSAIATSATFYNPIGVAVDGAGDVLVADTGNSTIRLISAAGAVTTLAGKPPDSFQEYIGSTDGVGSAARFSYPNAVTVNSSGTIYIADTANDQIRSGVPASLTITTQPQSQTTIAGATVTFSVAANGPGTLTYQWYQNGTAISGATSASYTISNVQNSSVGTYTVVVTSSSSGITPVTSTGATLTLNGNITAPQITVPPSGQTVTAGSPATFTVTATGGSLNYQWNLNGSAITGATSSTLSFPHAATSQAGFYSVTVWNQAGSVTSSNAVLAVNYSAKLTNISARASVGTSGNILIAGFSLAGSGSRQVLLRGVGPGLNATFGLTGILATPKVALYDGANPALVIATDTGWANAPVAGNSLVSAGSALATAPVMASVGAFSLAAGSADCAMLVTPPAGSYTAQLSGVGSTTGIGLAEIYDADSGSAPERLTNISARASVGSGGNILIGGFSIAGSTPETVLIRGVGPGLTATFGLTGVLATPQLALYDGASTPLVIATNTGWGNAPVTGNSAVQAGVLAASAAVMTQVGAFSLASGSADCAMVATLPPGSYTVQLSGVASTTGIGLVEIYEVP
jgi:Immunoglobulin domain/NHL repeat